MLQVVDLSRAASGLDLRPNRLAVMIGAAKSFIRAYFHHNPLSYLSVLVMRDGVAVKLTELGGSPERQIQELSALMDTSE
jgi:transcription initiation factor TFIIH subunit 2